MLTYLLIFVAKLTEVVLATVRNVLINRGEKGKGAFIGFFEILIWVFVVSTVITNVTEDPLKVVVFCLAFSLGNYLGVVIEGKLAIGNACIQAIIGQNKKEIVAADMRKKGFGVTTIRGEGMDGEVDVLMIFLKRKQVEEAIATIREECPTSLITINDVRRLSKGFIKK